MKNIKSTTKNIVNNTGPLKKAFVELLNSKNLNFKRKKIANYLNASLSEDENFSISTATEFYNNTIDFLFQNNLLDNRMGVIIHELTHASIGVGFKYPPSLIIAEDLVIKFKSSSSNTGSSSVNCLTSFVDDDKTKKYVEIEECYTGKKSSKTRRFIIEANNGVCYFQDKFSQHIKEKDLVWMLLSAPAIDLQLTKKLPNIKILKKRAISKRIFVVIPFFYPSDLKNSLKLIKKKITARGLIDDINKNYKIVCSNEIEKNSKLKEMRKIVKNKLQIVI